jgi:protein-tyrosine phosphatase
MHLLFVCTGNICRSPTAERLTRAFAVNHGLSQLTASSAGTRAVVGYVMEPTAAEMLRRLGGDPKGFRARQLSPANVASADLILTMTTRHRDRVLSESPRAMRRTFTLLEAGRLLTVPVEAETMVQRLTQARGQQTCGERMDDIADPIGLEYATFEAIGSQVAEALRPLLGALREDPTLS